MKRFLSAFSVIFLMATSSALAGGPPPATWDLTPGVSSDETKTRAFGGLTWSFGAAAPEAVIGAFHTKVKPDGDTTGGNAFVQIAFWNGISLSKVKAQYLHGNEDAQVAGGLGYDFNTSQPILSLGGNFPYVSAGLDVEFMNGFGITPFATVHSQDEFENNNTTPASCDAVGDGSGEFSDSECLTPVD